VLALRLGGFGVVGGRVLTRTMSFHRRHAAAKSQDARHPPERRFGGAGLARWRSLWRPGSAPCAAARCVVLAGCHAFSRRWHRRHKQHRSSARTPWSKPSQPAGRRRAAACLPSGSERRLRGRRVLLGGSGSRTGDLDRGAPGGAPTV
jgi:hypothetical protein